jgi:hypothetical protein
MNIKHRLDKLEANAYKGDKFTVIMKNEAETNKEALARWMAENDRIAEPEGLLVYIKIYGVSANQIQGMQVWG